MAPPGKLDRLAEAVRAVIGPAVGGAAFGHPPLVRVEAGRRAREAQLELGAVAAPGGDRRGQGRGVVDDQQVARLEQLGKVAEARVGDPPVAAGRDQQPDLVAREPARLGRLVSLELGRQGEGRGAHTGAGTSSAAR